jgi:putative transposase
VLKHSENSSIRESMKLVANLQLTPTKKEQAKALLDTLERCNAACNAISQRGYETGATRKYDLQKLLYFDTRRDFDLTAQAVIRCIAKVADAYTTQKANTQGGVIKFRKHAAQPYDDRIFRFVAGDMVSIWTLSGRMKIPFVCGERQRTLLAYRKGEVDLMLVRDKWYLAVVCDIPDPEKIAIEDILGVDLTVVNIAFDSDGRPYTGAEIEKPETEIHPSPCHADTGTLRAPASFEETRRKAIPPSRSNQLLHFQEDCCWRRTLPQRDCMS